LNYGTVIATGPGLTFTNGALRENTVKVGQTVLLPGYSGAKITLSDKQDYYVYRDDDILGILEEPTK
jgi:chaperonin GroES